MNSFNKRVYEMLNRIIVFPLTYPEFFAKDTLPAQLFEKIQASPYRTVGVSRSVECEAPPPAVPHLPNTAAASG